MKMIGRTSSALGCGMFLGLAMIVSLYVFPDVLAGMIVFFATQHPLVKIGGLLGGMLVVISIGSLIESWIEEGGN